MADGVVWDDHPDVVWDDQAPSAPKGVPAVTLGAGDTGAFHAMRHLSFGLGDKILAAVQALDDMRHDKTGKSFGDTYDRNLAFNDQLIEDSDQAHPVARWVGNGVGVGGNLVGLAAMAPARAALAARGLVPAAERVLAAPSVLGRAIQGGWEGVKTGMPLGAASGFGAARDGNSGWGTTLGALFGGLSGGLFGGLGGGVAAKLAQRAAPTPGVSVTIADLASEANQSLPMVARGVTPDPEAQVLQRYGVPLTLGQMQPGGVASEAEEAAMRVPLLGKAIEGQRNAAEQSWRDAVINTTRGPMEGPVGPGSAIDKIGRIKQDLSASYEQIADRPAAALASHPETGELVHPREALGAILADPQYQAGADDLGRAGKIFENQLAKVERLQEAGQPIKARTLMDMRSDLRDAAQFARLNGNHSASMMFQDAADSMTGGLRGTQVGKDLTLLDQTDAAWSKMMKVAGAIKRAGGQAEEGEFGPKQLSAELQKAYGLRFATDANAGGELRDLSRAGKYAFTNRAPMTGHGDKFKGALGLALGGQIHRANMDPATQTLFMLAAQRAAERGAPSMLPPVASEIEQTLGSLMGQTPVTAASVSPGVASLLSLLRGGQQ